MLYIIATPIGNLGDITFRSLRILKEVDGIICEDSRRTSILLQHFQIKKPLLVLNDYNESLQVNNIIQKLKDNQNLALVSDAGTPLISDPGFKLVRECIKNNIEVDSIPGPSSVITALTLSGLPTDKFTFLGYLPDKSGHRLQTYQKIKASSDILNMTFIIFVAPFKIKKTLNELFENFGDINITLAKELTKIHQKVETKYISKWLETFNSDPKGEWIMMFNLNS